jgi:hypothetical protein
MSPEQYFFFCASLFIRFSFLLLYCVLTLHNKQHPIYIANRHLNYNLLNFIWDIDLWNRFLHIPTKMSVLSLSICVHWTESLWLWILPELIQTKLELSLTHSFSRSLTHSLNWGDAIIRGKLFLYSLPLSVTVKNEWKFLCVEWEDQFALWICP